MPTIRERILAHLQAHPEGATDSELTRPLGLKNQAQANQRCHQLADEGPVVRRRVNGRLRNYATGAAQGAPPPAPPAPPARPRPEVGAGHRPWHWEGNVQSWAAAYLLRQGYFIRRVADTAAHEHGIDLVAEKGGRELWVTVKGFPAGTRHTQPSTQPGIWFEGALFDIIEWRGQDPGVELAIALPDLPRYRHLAERVHRLQPIAGFSYLWVHEDGSVSREDPAQRPA